MEILKYPQMSMKSPKIYPFLHWMINKYFAIPLFFTFIVIGCSKPDLQQRDASENVSFQNLRRPVLSGFTVNSLSYHGDEEPMSILNGRKRNDTDPGGDGPPDVIMSTYKDGPGLIVPTFYEPTKTDVLFLHQKYKSQMFTIADQAMALNIYPGAILDGRSIEGVFEPKMLQGISSNIRPITISTSMPVSGSAVARTSLPRPIAERALYNTALTDLENINSGGIGAASLQVEIDSFTVYEELKTLYGYNKGIDVFLVNSNTTKQGENHLITAKSAIKIKFFQQNFTIDVDAPNSYSELFDPAGLDMNTITGGVTPVYVKSVTYGRMGIMVIESTKTSDKLYNAVYKQLGILKNLIGIDRNMTQEEKDIINEADIKIKYTGIGRDADETIKISGLSGFIDILTANKTYSKESPGVPVAFQLAYLNDDHSLVEAPFQINYGPFDKPYARIEYRNLKTADVNEFQRGTMRKNVDLVLRFFKDASGFNSYDAPNFISFSYKTKNKKITMSRPIPMSVFNKSSFPLITTPYNVEENELSTYTIKNDLRLTEIPLLSDVTITDISWTMYNFREYPNTIVPLFFQVYA